MSIVYCKKGYQWAGPAKMCEVPSKLMEFSGVVSWELIGAMCWPTVPSYPRMIWTFLNLGKISNWENFEFSGPPLKTWKLSLKHLKLPKNHFKTTLFSLQLKYLKCAFTFGKKMKIRTPPPLVKKSKFWILDFLIFGADPSPPFWTFSIIWDFFFWMLP